jgi:hypothetical protein
MAVHRLARLAAQEHTLVDQLLAVAINDIACRATVAVASSERLTKDLAKRIKRDLDSLPRVCYVGDRLNTMERMCALDAVFYLKRHGVLRGLETLVDGRPERRLDFSRAFSFDANIVTRRVNRWYDRLVAIAELPPNPRKHAFKKFWTDLEDGLARVKRPTRLIAAIFSLNARSEAIAAIVANLLLPAMDAAKVAEDRAQTTVELTRLAATLAIYHAEHRNYPTKLQDLVPEFVEKLPVDLYNDQTFAYKRTEDGYLLYSAGENGNDEGGDNARSELIAGRPLVEVRTNEPQQLTPEIAADADDISIRMPRPHFRLPKKLPATNQN